MISSLLNISPIDGRYTMQTESLKPLFSEYGLMRYRVYIEIEWLKTLANCSEINELPALSAKAQLFLEHIWLNFNEQDAQTIKGIEQKTQHDLKAIEYFLKQKLTTHPELSPYIEFIHFACTSEDINNLSYSLILKEARNQILIPAINQLIDLFTTIAEKEAATAMLARTHGQAATPTTLGKEFAVFASRLYQQKNILEKIQIRGKLNGAVGNFNAHIIAYPEIDWLNLSQNFIKHLGLIPNLYTTQIEPHDYLAEFSHALFRINNILINAAQDIWGYISLNYFNLKIDATEIGSSTMPHKINPINFENAEGNLALANTLLDHFARSLPCSRWQRDLRDSTLLRNLGVALGHTLVAYQNLVKGLKKLRVNYLALDQNLNAHWEILAEAIQTVLRRHGIKTPYEQLKKLTQGQAVDQSSLHQFIQSLALPDEIKEKLLNLTPKNYIGKAEELARNLKKLNYGLPESIDSVTK